ncbi:hypothetical protein ACFPAG_08590 [Vogesella sp. GCM10023246]|uniref:Uncharacterized protein n=1 Tax=Vogesella oryzagri TaxID=3160864 RepID=A0ABV1M3P8_9NEIS
MRLILPDSCFKFLRLLLAAFIAGALLRHSGLSNNASLNVATITLYLLAFLQLAAILHKLDQCYLRHLNRR